MENARLMQQVQASVTSRAIDMIKAQGAAVIDLINASGSSGQGQVFTDPMLGRNVDVMA